MKRKRMKQRIHTICRAVRKGPKEQLSVSENDVPFAHITLSTISDTLASQLSKFRSCGNVATFDVCTNNPAFLVPKSS